MSAVRTGFVLALVVSLQVSPSGQVWTDPSGHRVSFITVATGVNVEVLDWGGRGPTILLLAGGGNTAHVFDSFANRLTDGYRVLALTRRGYGASSRPPSGYSLDTLTRDIVAVLDQLRIERVIMIGHSRAGAEMTKIAATNPARVNALVYLDAAVDRSRPPKTPAPERRITEADLASVERFNAWLERSRGMRYPEGEIRAIREVDSGGGVHGPTTSEALNALMSTTSDERPDYSKVLAPSLAIYSPSTMRALFPDYASLDPQERALADRRVAEARMLKDDAIKQFRLEVKQGQVVVLDSGVHHIFLSNESEVVSLVQTFLRDLAIR